LLTGGRAYATSNPLIETVQHGRGLAEPEITLPALKVAAHLTNHLFEADASGSTPDSAIRDLLSSAIQDRNVLIGDSAFEEREMFDMVRTGPPGECFEIVPALHKSAHWLSGEHDLLPVGFPVTYTYGCIPPPEPASK
jgi:hypothetical protein